MMCHRFRSAYHYTNEEKLSALYQLLQYRHNVRLRWSKLDTSLQHPHNFPRFLLNLSDGMLTRQHQTISVDYVFPLYIFFCYRKHILYQKYTLPAVVQFNDIENVARFPGLFFFSIIRLYLSMRLDNGSSSISWCLYLQKIYP